MDWSELISATNKSVKAFNFAGMNTIGKVCNVYDGDTCRVIFYFHDQLTRLTVRLASIDTPEIRSKDPNEIEHGLKARDFLSNLVLNQLVYVELGKYDKYKRPLTNIYLLDQDLNKIGDKTVQEMLVENKLAIHYTGGTRIPYSDW